MKRKRCQDLKESAPLKRVAEDLGQGRPPPRCPLIRILEQYGLLACITRHLFPKDLQALAATSRMAYNAIFPRKSSRASLFKKMRCDGGGVALRKVFHPKSEYSRDATETVQCGALTKDRDVESHPCVRCQVTTCNECRVHCVYQSIRHPADEPDEFDNYSGFILLDGAEMGILSHSHMLSNDSLPEDVKRWGSSPHHDQGFLDIPLDSDTFVPPVEIEELINIDLGMRPITAELSSGATHPSSILRTFWDITEKRKRPCCESCLARYLCSSDKSHTVCRCTLKSHFLDRWLCLCCHQKEQKTIEKLTEGALHKYPEYCECGETLSDDTEHVICLWCSREVMNPWGCSEVQPGTPSTTTTTA